MFILTHFLGDADLQEEGSKLTRPGEDRCRHAWFSDPDPQDGKQLLPISVGAGTSEHVLKWKGEQNRTSRGGAFPEGSWDRRRDTRLPCQLGREGEQQARCRGWAGWPCQPGSKNME